MYQVYGETDEQSMGKLGKCKTEGKNQREEIAPVGCFFENECKYVVWKSVKKLFIK